MSEFQPPFEERDTGELIHIIMSPDRWTKKAVQAARQELLNRGISLEEQEEVIREFKENEKKWLEWQEKEYQKQLEKNKTESYEIWELILLFLIAPFLFFVKSNTHRFYLYKLYKEKYKLKFKQALIVTILSYIAWFMFMKYQIQKKEEKRQAEIEKIDISDWEKKYDYELIMVG